MSNFNKLDCIVKESIQVDAKGRFTPQKVRFINRENEFYGTFIGKAKINDSTLNNVELSNCVFYDEEGQKINMNDILRLEKRVSKNEFDIHNINELIYDLSGNQIPAWIEGAVTSASMTLSNLILSEIKKESEARIEADNEISSKLTTLSSEFVSNIERLDTKIEKYVGDISTGLSIKLDNLSGALSTGIDNLSTGLSTEIDNLSTALSTEIDVLSNEINKTLKGFDKEAHPQHISTDNLVMTSVDENVDGVHKKFYLTMLSGTMVLKQIF